MILKRIAWGLTVRGMNRPREPMRAAAGGILRSHWSEFRFTKSADGFNRIQEFIEVIRLTVNS